MKPQGVRKAGRGHAVSQRDNGGLSRHRGRATARQQADLEQLLTTGRIKRRAR